MGDMVFPTLLDNANVTIMADEVNSTEVVTVVSYGSEATVVTPAAYACNVSQPIPSAPLCSSCQCCCPASLSACCSGLGCCLTDELHLSIPCTSGISLHICDIEMHTCNYPTFRHHAQSLFWVVKCAINLFLNACGLSMFMQCLEPGLNTLQPVL